MFNTMARYQLTPEKAREAGLKSARLRAERKAYLLTINASTHNGAMHESPSVAETQDPFIAELERAMEETLQELRDADTAKDRAACAQALRNLRETYHLVTGLERPGVSKGKRGKTSKRDYHKPASAPPQQVVSKPKSPDIGNANEV